MSNDQVAEPTTGSGLEKVSKTVAKYVAIVTALISIAVPLTEWIRGFSNQRIKEVEARSQLEMKELEKRSELATAYLTRLTAPGIGAGDRIMLLSALAQLENHPLQKWASEERNSQIGHLELLKSLGTRIQESIDRGVTVQSKYEELSAEIDIAKMKLSLATNLAELDQHRQQLLSLNAARNDVRADIDLPRIQRAFNILVLQQVQRYLRKEDHLSLTPVSGLERFDSVAASAKVVAYNAADINTRMAAIRLAGASAWLGQDFVLSEELQEQGLRFCLSVPEPSYRFSRDCAFLQMSEVLAKHLEIVAHVKGRRDVTTERVSDPLSQLATGISEPLSQLASAIQRHKQLLLREKLRGAGADSAFDHFKEIEALAKCMIAKVDKDEPIPLSVLHSIDTEMSPLDKVTCAANLSVLRLPEGYSWPR